MVVIIKPFEIFIFFFQSLQTHSLIVVFFTFIHVLHLYVGRRGGLKVSALDSRASAPGSSPGRGHCVVFLGRALYSHGASRGGVEILSVASCYRTGISSSLMGLLARMQTLPSSIHVLYLIVVLLYCTV